MTETGISVAASAPRFRCDYVEAARPVPTIEEDARRGLLTRPRRLPAKYFYDARGSALFEQICATPEYYPTRTEDSLLASHAHTVIGTTRPDNILEIGSGTSRKTRRLLDACHSIAHYPSYTAFDISEQALAYGGHRLTQTYDWLHINLLVGDYEAGFKNVPPSRGSRLIVFLGSTIGNFEPHDASAFLADLRATMASEDRLLLGFDRVKDERVLSAAYNDSAGLTAAFNLNVLTVLNAELDGDFEPGKFRHLALYNSEQMQIEMHLVSETAHQVRLGRLEARLDIERGERIRTEISRKFTRQSLTRLLVDSGFAIEQHFAPQNGYFSLVLASPA